MNDKKLRTFQNLCTAAIICTGISIFICGILLGVAGLVCAILAYNQFKKMDLEQHSVEYRLLKRKSFRTLIFAVMILILNIISAIILFPALMEQINQLYAQYGLTNGASSVSSVSSGSIWD